MTQAQKNAKAKFKQAIAYRQKTGVSLKEAFAHIYGKKKVGAVKKKSAPKKKVAKKKLAKKKITRIEYDKRYQAKKPGKRKSASGKTYYENRENRSDKGKLLGIGSVKNMTDKYIKTLNEIYQYNKAINIIQNDMTRLNYSPMEKQRAKQTIANFKKIVKELKIHSKELKKLI